MTIPLAGAMTMENVLEVRMSVSITFAGHTQAELVELVVIRQIVTQICHVTTTYVDLNHAVQLAIQTLVIALLINVFGTLGGMATMNHQSV